jgi:hypothetical protein
MFSGFLWGKRIGILVFFSSILGTQSASRLDFFLLMFCY